jgi:hypothetical protein
MVVSDLAVAEEEVGVLEVLLQLVIKLKVRAKKSTKCWFFIDGVF